MDEEWARQREGKESVPNGIQPTGKMDNGVQVQSLVEEGGRNLPTTFRITLTKDVIIQTLCKTVANWLTRRINFSKTVMTSSC